MTRRPPHLPEFRNPPVSEVVLGVQFRKPTGYQQIRAGEVWSLYRDQYPNVEEHPPIAPQFETFGPTRSSQLAFNLISGASHDRFWFVSEAGTELIQFQEDRLLHNWRKMDSEENVYPRFESMLPKFDDELRRLDNYMAALSPQALDINQCEVTYINAMQLADIPSSRPATWLKGFDLPNGGPDDFSYLFKHEIRDDEGRPTGRLTCEAISGLTPELEPVIRLTLTVRGTPASPSIKDAIAYLKQGRDAIVLAFADITSDAAQKHWERIQ